MPSPQISVVRPRSPLPAGPEARAGSRSLGALVEALLRDHAEWARERGALDAGKTSPARLEAALRQTFERLQANHFMGGTRYAGHMRTQPAMPAILAGMVADLFGLNMLVGEQCGEAREIEREVIADLCGMAGLPERAGGRLAAGGTICNTEALYVALRVASFYWETRALGERLQIAPPASSHPAEALGYARALVERLVRTEGPWGLELLHDCTSRPDAALPQFAILVGRNAHYSLEKAVKLVGGGRVWCVPVDVDAQFRMDLQVLQRLIAELKEKQVQVVAVVSTAGSTATGSVDPLESVADLQREHGFWWHVDAAYGGYLRSLLFEAGDAGRPAFRGSSAVLPEETQRAFRHFGEATSVTIDPHKLGYLPTGCGAVLFSDLDYPAFIEQGGGYFQEEDLDRRLRLGARQCFMSGIEGSRSGRAPIACRVMNDLYPLHRDGIGQLLSPGLRKCRQVWGRLCALEPIHGLRFLPVHEPMTNIFCVTLGAPGGDVQEANAWTQRFADEVKRRGDLFCTLNVFTPDDGTTLFRQTLPRLGLRNTEGLTHLNTLRFVFSNPQAFEGGTGEFEAVTRDIIERLAASRPSRTELV